MDIMPIDILISVRHCLSNIEKALKTASVAEIQDILNLVLKADVSDWDALEKLDREIHELSLDENLQTSISIYINFMLFKFGIKQQNFFPALAHKCAKKLLHLSKYAYLDIQGLILDFSHKLSESFLDIKSIKEIHDWLHLLLNGQIEKFGTFEHPLQILEFKFNMLLWREISIDNYPHLVEILEELFAVSQLNWNLVNLNSIVSEITLHYMEQFRKSNFNEGQRILDNKALGCMQHFNLEERLCNKIRQLAN
ncbi:unnamed protein product [Blepharisma stoltei]|uniref:Uncharacterized protein n=1 Tax=Blepharisma stoltei TaxID=1481888 RepID=A0AAU9JE80_9CILI|nr:unnamed protein product [Blepharisma stoltei]